MASQYRILAQFWHRGRACSAPLLAKPDNRIQQPVPFSLTANVSNKSGNLLLAQS